MRSTARIWAGPKSWADITAHRPTGPHPKQTAIRVLDACRKQHPYLEGRVRLVATAAVVTPMLGGTRQQVIGALSNAWLDGGALGPYLREPMPGARKSWAAGDATSRGVRLAMLAIAGDAGGPSALSAQDSGFGDVLFRGRPLALPRPLASHMLENLQFRGTEAVPALRQKFESSVAAHFPAGQAAKIGALAADRARTEAMPIHQFVAVMVKN
jgi:hypothetical protein